MPTKDEKDNLEQINMAFHMFMKYNRAAERLFCPLKQSNCIKNPYLIVNAVGGQL